MNKYSSKSAQGGFTLIELIVVIVILGILAATALPKFASLGGDARAASLQAAKGSVNSSAAIYHGKWLIDASATAISIEGASVGIVNGYPAATKAFATAAGLSEDDYTITEGTGSLTVSPAKLSTDAQATCKLTYTEATVNATTKQTTPPVVTLDTSRCE